MPAGLVMYGKGMGNGVGRGSGPRYPPPEPGHFAARKKMMKNKE